MQLILNYRIEPIPLGIIKSCIFGPWLQQLRKYDCSLQGLSRPRATHSSGKKISGNS